MQYKLKKKAFNHPEGKLFNDFLPIKGIGLQGEDVIKMPGELSNQDEFDTTILFTDEDWFELVDGTDIVGLSKENAELRKRRAIMFGILKANLTMFNSLLESAQRSLEFAGDMSKAQFENLPWVEKLREQIKIIAATIQRSEYAEKGNGNTTREIGRNNQLRDSNKTSYLAGGGSAETVTREHFARIESRANEQDKEQSSEGS